MSKKEIPHADHTRHNPADPEASTRHRIEPGNPHDGPVFTIGEIMEILEDRPEIREALRQSLLEKTAKKQEKDSPNVPQQG